MGPPIQRHGAALLVASAASLAACGGSGGGSEPTSQLQLLGACWSTLDPDAYAAAGTTPSCAFQLFNKGAGASRASTLSLSTQAPLLLAGVRCGNLGGPATLCPTSPGAVSRVPPLPPGTQLSFVVDIAIPEGSNGRFRLSAQIDEDGTQPNEFSRGQVAVNAFWTDLDASLSVNAQSVAGTEAVFTATLVNRGGGTFALQGQPVNLSLPPGLTTTDPFTTPCVTASGGYCPNFDPKRGWGLIIAPFDTQIYTYRVAVPADYRGALTAVFSAPTAGDPSASNNTATASTQVVPGP